MLEALEEASLVEKREDPADKRKKLIFLTERGCHLKGLVQQKAFSFHQELALVHGVEDLETAKKVLKTIYSNLKEKISNEDQT